MHLSNIVNLVSYPIHDSNTQIYKNLINKYRGELDTVGCCRISNFIRKESIIRMHAEVERKRGKIYWSQDSHNPYFTKEDPLLPKDHPKRIFEKRESGYVNSDILEENSDLRTLYKKKELVRFVSDCLGVAPIYCWADPLGSNPYSIMDHGHYFPWHFDGNEFTLSILIQKSEQGGIFEYCPDLRSPEDENFKQVAEVLKGNRDRVHTLDLNPGDLQIFKGRFSMHRVTRVEGNRSRYIALPTYVRNPNRVNKPEHSKQVYGRAMPIHFERESIQADKLTD